MSMEKVGGSAMGQTQESISDNDQFIIDTTTLLISPKTSEKKELLQYDTLTHYGFVAPRYIDGHDTRLSTSIQIHYINISHDKEFIKSGVYNVDDYTLDDQNTSFIWEVSNNATGLIGTLHFAIRFLFCAADNIVTEYTLRTKPYSSISILSRADNIPVSSDGLSEIVNQWYAEFTKYIDPPPFEKIKQTVTTDLIDGDIRRY